MLEPCQKCWRIVFSTRLQPGIIKQHSYFSGSGANSDLTELPNPNPLLDIGCPRSVTDRESAAILCESMDIQLQLQKLDCEPFYHCFGNNCVEGNLVSAKWVLPLKDLNGTSCEIPFYVVKGNGPMLVGNNILADSNLSGQDNLLVIPPQVGTISSVELLFPIFKTYQDASHSRTFLHVVPSQLRSLSTFFSSIQSFTSSLRTRDFTKGKQAEAFPIRFQMYTHFHPNDMDIICKRAGILTPIL